MILGERESYLKHLKYRYDLGDCSPFLPASVKERYIQFLGELNESDFFKSVRASNIMKGASLKAGEYTNMPATMIEIALIGEDGEKIISHSMTKQPFFIHGELNETNMVRTVWVVGHDMNVGKFTILESLCVVRSFLTSLDPVGIANIYEMRVGQEYAISGMVLDLEANRVDEGVQMLSLENVRSL